LDTVAPADNVGTDHYKGLFLENVLGLWVQAYGYKSDGVTPQLLNPPTSNPSYDSSSNPYNPATFPHPLPAYVIISIAVLDSPSALRLQKMSGLSGTTAGAASQVSGYYTAPDAESFVEDVQAAPGLAAIRSGISAVSLRVDLENYK
jgi:hypothetical protein